MLIPLGFLAASGAGAAGAYELISSTILGSDTSSVSFSSIPSDYKHLQIRLVARNASNTSSMILTLNSDTGSNYVQHDLVGNGSTVSSTANVSGEIAGIRLNNFQTSNTATASAFGAGVVDILDYTNTSKNTTVRALGGRHSGASSHFIRLISGLWIDTSAVSTITLAGITFLTGSRFSLYGIKG
jgi:hypothetical protein